MFRSLKKIGVDIPPWVILASVLILVPIFLFWTIQNIHKQKEQMVLLLLEKGAALIRSFEAGTRTGMMGMMGMHGGRFQLQNLLMETAQQPDIVHLIVTDSRGRILAHNDPSRIGGIYGEKLDLEEVARSDDIRYRQVGDRPGGREVFEVFRRFSPTTVLMGRRNGPMGAPRRHNVPPDFRELKGESDRIIFVGMDMTSLEEARRADNRHTMIMAAILLLIGFTGIFMVFLAQAYRTTRTSLTRIKAFSDNVVENMPIGLVAVDGEGKIASFNQAAESLLNVSAREVLGKKGEEVLPGALWGITNELRKKPRILDGELDCSLGGDRVLPLDVSASVLRGQDGGTWGHLILFRDLSEVRDLKREIERSRRLASLGRLAAGVAHEIRNPLSSIKGFATYFRDRYRENPEDQATADIMIQEVERLNRVITQLLDFARPVTLQKRRISLHSVIQHSLKMVEQQAEHKGIRIDAELSARVNEAWMDPDRINQVLLNLYLNAIEAMEGGGTLSVKVGLDEDDRVTIVVSDTGVGIREEDLAHVFDPYFTTRSSGTGLGLAIVHKIIETHGGEVRVESEKGKGTKVTVVLPTDTPPTRKE
ncbi:MAG: PAS domain-containing protein [Deltaproteobacteria bacterium]|nr:PAS domain-containing protein [Deltaproteobacteria bacterium]MBW2018079.1 PAS domain-containing protein [Deltaproteobacteria bacterium]MBW2129096.1 PAS domain-containing protein [Deltaproteobacteria bacterium]MBW2304041.1 PAS domain-containing protein [Deltaproteobacteria bacterium]